MRLSRALEDKKYDVRLRDKYLYDGKISKDEVKQYLEKLEDNAGNFEYTEKEDHSESSDNE